MSLVFICDKALSRKPVLLLRLLTVTDKKDAAVMTPTRRCFALDLADDPGLIAQYERAHAPGAVWPAVVEHLRASGVLSMEIWRAGDRLFMICTVSDDYPRAVDAPPEVGRWEELMWRFQRPLPGTPAGEKWVPMHRIFSLDEQ